MFRYRLNVSTGICKPAWFVDGFRGRINSLNFDAMQDSQFILKKLLFDLTTE